MGGVADAKISLKISSCAKSMAAHLPSVHLGEEEDQILATLETDSRGSWEGVAATPISPQHLPLPNHHPHYAHHCSPGQLYSSPDREQGFPGCRDGVGAILQGCATGVMLGTCDGEGAL